MLLIARAGLCFVMNVARSGDGDNTVDPRRARMGSLEA